MLTPPAQARLIAKLIPGARLEVFPGGGHMLMLERADELNRLIVDFAHEVWRGSTVARRLTSRAEALVPGRRVDDPDRGRAGRALDR